MWQFRTTFTAGVPANAEDLATIDLDLARETVLRLMPDACLRVNRSGYLIYSSHGQGASFRTADLRVALWILEFSTPKSIEQVLHGLLPSAHASTVALIDRLRQLGVLVEEHYVAALNSESEHRASTNATAALLDSIYDLAGELRSLGPIAHERLRQESGLSLQHRIEGLLTAVGTLQNELAGLRETVVKERLTAHDIHADSKELRLHIGSGGFDLPSWINIDNYPAPLALNIGKPLPFPDASAAYVFSAHVLEHLFHPGQTLALLGEIKRVLRPGGVLRLVVPDIEQCVDAYTKEDRVFFSDNEELAEQSTNANRTLLEHFLTYAGAGLSPDKLFDAHKFGFDFVTLERCLKRCGFIDIRRCDYQSSPHPQLRVDHASASAGEMHEGRYRSLFVEATC